MRRIGFLLFGFLAFLVLFSAQSANARLQSSAKQESERAAPGMNSQDVIKMVSAGLSEDVIIGAIRKVAKPDFDLTPDGLIALSKAGVSTGIIRAMQGGNDTSAPSASSTAAFVNPFSTRSVEGREAGIYFKDADKMTQLEPSAFSGGKSGNMFVSGLTYGVKKTKWKALVRSPRASQRILMATPEFYFYFEARGAGLSNSAFASFAGASSPNEFVLVKMDRSGNQREVTVGEFGITGTSSGTASHDSIDLNVEKISPGSYRVTPKDPLKPGEYCFFYASGSSMFAAAGRGKLFDFGID
jgi:hypothetical protein